MQDGELKIDSDFYSVENGVYLSNGMTQPDIFYMERSRGFDRQPDFWMEK